MTLDGGLEKLSMALPRRMGLPGEQLGSLKIGVDMEQPGSLMNRMDRMGLLGEQLGSLKIGVDMEQPGSLMNRMDRMGLLGQLDNL
jgi:hypothetical protein